MATYLVSYDLTKPDRDYPRLHAAIEAYGTYWHCLDSVWIISARGTALDVANNLARYIDRNDKLIVTQVTKNTAWSGLSQDGINWLNSRLAA